jgi:hypothetical protein
MEIMLFLRRDLKQQRSRHLQVALCPIMLLKSAQPVTVVTGSWVLKYLHTTIFFKFSHEYLQEKPYCF